MPAGRAGRSAPRRWRRREEERGPAGGEPKLVARSEARSPRGRRAADPLGHAAFLAHRRPMRRLVRGAWPSRRPGRGCPVEPVARLAPSAAAEPRVWSRRGASRRGGRWRWGTANIIPTAGDGRGVAVGRAVDRHAAEARVGERPLRVGVGTAASRIASGAIIACSEKPPVRASTARPSGTASRSAASGGPSIIDASASAGTQMCASAPAPARRPLRVGWNGRVGAPASRGRSAGPIAASGRPASPAARPSPAAAITPPASPAPADAVRSPRPLVLGRVPSARGSTHGWAIARRAPRHHHGASGSMRTHEDGPCRGAGR